MAAINAWDGGRIGAKLSKADVGSAASIAISTAVSAQCYRVRVSGDKAYWVKIGDGAQTAVHGDALVPAGAIDYFTVSPGQGIAAISTSTSSGYISVHEIY